MGRCCRSCPTTDDDDAVRIANDTVYGLAAYVQSEDIEHARADRAPHARRLGLSELSRHGTRSAPFGGYKQSGNGREYADWAIHDFLEIKGVVGYSA